MDANKSMGLFLIIIGLLFMIFPMFSAELISIIVGFSLLFLGILAIYSGINIKEQTNNPISTIFIIIGIIVAILGFLFIFYIDAVSFLIGIQFYLLGFIMVIFGIGGLMSKRSGTSIFTSVLFLIMGIISILLAAFAIAEPIYIAIIIGVVLVIEGVMLLLSD